MTHYVVTQLHVHICYPLRLVYWTVTELFSCIYLPQCVVFLMLCMYVCSGYSRCWVFQQLLLLYCFFSCFVDLTQSENLSCRFTRARTNIWPSNETANAEDGIVQSNASRK